MRNGRSPRRWVSLSAPILAALLAAPGCQRPLLQAGTPPAPRSEGWAERAQNAELATAPRWAQADRELPPARTTDSVRRTAATAPTPMLDALAAKNADNTEAHRAAKAATAAMPDDEADEEPAAETDPRKDAAAEAESKEDGVAKADPKKDDEAKADPKKGDDAKDTKEPATAAVELPSSEAPPISGPETRIVIKPSPPKAAEEKPEPPSPDELWREGLKQLLAVARDRAGANDDSAGDWALRLALLGWMTDPGDKPARADWRSVLAPLVHAADASAADKPTLADELRGAVATLDNLAPLEITSIELCRKVKGFGSYEPLERAACKSGRAVIVYCEMAGVHYEKDGDTFRSRLAAQVELRRKDGGENVWSQELGVAEDACRRRRRDYYVNYRLDLPSDLPPGAYELHLTQTDLVSHQSASRTAALTLSP